MYQYGYEEEEHVWGALAIIIIMTIIIVKAIHSSSQALPSWTIGIFGGAEIQLRQAKQVQSK